MKLFTSRKSSSGRESRAEAYGAHIALVSLMLGGCLGMPHGVEPVKDFDIERYAGKWYEIARLDHRFERGLQNVTAQYSLNDDGSIEVINRGYSSVEGRWKVATGKAYFVDGEDVGYLKVSFFGPFYGSYVVFELDKTDYDYAFVVGADTTYLWLLARSPEVDKATVELFVDEATALGIDPDELIFVDHSKRDAAP